MTLEYAFFPIRYPHLLKFYEDQDRIRWSVNEVGLGIQDRKDWDEMTEAERTFLKFPLAFFAQADGIINENLVENFKRETSHIKEARAFYALQEATEVIHNHCYSLLIETFIRDPVERNEMFDAIHSHKWPCLKHMSDWMTRYMDSSLPLCERVIAFACVEGVMFSSAFAAIYWIKRKNILHGLTKANEWIARDEGLHTRFAVALYHHLTSIEGHASVSAERAASIVQEACTASERFVRDGLQVNLIGLHADDMVGYVKSTGDALLVSLGFEKLYGISNPLVWMSIISLPNKTNFFEAPVSEYAAPIEGGLVIDVHALPV